MARHVIRCSGVNVPHLVWLWGGLLHRFWHVFHHEGCPFFGFGSFWPFDVVRVLSISMFVSIRSGSGFCGESTRPQPSFNRMEEHLRKKERRHWMFTSKTSRGKTTGAHRLQTVHYVIRGTMRNSEAMTSSSITSPTGGYKRCNNLYLELSLSLSLYMQTLNTQNDNNYNYVCPSYIYTYITFRWFTNIASISA